MDARVRNYILATLLVIAVSLIAVVLFSNDFMDNFLIVIGIVIVYPCTVMGVYFYLEGKGYRWINGIDWTGLSEQERTNACSYVGFYLAIGCIILGIAITSRLVNFILGIILIVASIIIILSSFVMPERAKSKKFVEKSTGSKAAVFVVFSLLAIVPMTAIGVSQFSQDTVEVEFLDDEVHITAPMFNHHFKYELIEDLDIDPDFDKGSRIGGYATPTISSGTFKNDVFGSYRLASYTQVKPCVFFLYEGKYYAFNQASAELTEQAYQQLLSHVKG